MVQITKKRGKSPPTTPAWVIPTLIAIAVLTYLTLPDPFSPPPGDEPTINHVFYYGWLTALSTGLGAVPFFVLRGVADFWVGISNGMCQYHFFSSKDAMRIRDFVPSHTVYSLF